MTRFDELIARVRNNFPISSAYFFKRKKNQLVCVIIWSDIELHQMTPAGIRIKESQPEEVKGPPMTPA